MIDEIQNKIQKEKIINKLIKRKRDVYEKEIRRY